MCIVNPQYFSTGETRFSLAPEDGRVQARNSNPLGAGFGISGVLSSEPGHLRLELSKALMEYVQGSGYP